MHLSETAKKNLIEDCRNMSGDLMLSVPSAYSTPYGVTEPYAMLSDQLPKGWSFHECDDGWILAMNIKYDGQFGASLTYFEKKSMLAGAGIPDNPVMIASINERMCAAFISKGISLEASGIQLQQYGRRGGWLGFTVNDDSFRSSLFYDGPEFLKIIESLPAETFTRGQASTAIDIEGAAADGDLGDSVFPALRISAALLSDLAAARKTYLQAEKSFERLDPPVLDGIRSCLADSAPVKVPRGMSFIDSLSGRNSEKEQSR
jgi:hypothetical protein